MATITQIERYNKNLAKAQATIALTDMVLLQNSSISYSDLLDAITTAIGGGGGTTIVKEQITTASTIGEVAGTTYYYFCLTGDSYDLPLTDSNESVYNFKNDGADVIYLNADTGAGDTIEVEERGEVSVGTQLRVPPYESRCIVAFGTTWRIF